MKTLAWALLALLLASCSKSNQTSLVVGHTNQLEIVPRSDTNAKSSGPSPLVTNAPAQFRTIFQTNQNGLLQSAKTFDNNGNLKWMETYGYDSSTNLLETKRILPNGGVIALQYQYDSNGHRAGQRMIGTNGLEILP